MLFFENDYGYGAHPKVLEYLAQTNMEPVSGYGNDKFTAEVLFDHLQADWSNGHHLTTLILIFEEE